MSVKMCTEGEMGGWAGGTPGFVHDVSSLKKLLSLGGPSLDRFIVDRKHDGETWVDVGECETAEEAEQLIRHEVAAGHGVFEDYRIRGLAAQRRFGLLIWVALGVCVVLFVAFWFVLLTAGSH